MSALWILSLAAAAAQDCPTRVPVEEFTQRVVGLREPVALVEEPVAAEILALQQALERGCVDEPVQRKVLAALFLAEGAYAVLQGHPEQAQFSLGYAATLGGPSAQDPIYGPTVGRLYAEALAQPRAQSVLVVALQPAPDVLVLDGELRYDEGPYTLPEGVHVLQWVTDERWDGAVVQLRAGQQVSLGEAALQTQALDPTPSPSPQGLALSAGLGLGYARLGATPLESGARGPGGWSGGGAQLGLGTQLPLSARVSGGLVLSLGAASGRYNEHGANQAWGQLIGQATVSPAPSWQLGLGMGWALGRSRFVGLDPVSYQSLICAQIDCTEGLEPPDADLAAAPLLLRWGGPAAQLSARRTLAPDSAWSLGVDLNLARSSARWVGGAYVSLQRSWFTGWSPR